MDSNTPPIDEFTLAAYIAGTLPEDRRAEVAAYLAQNAEARELLQMAYEALEEARRQQAPGSAEPSISAAHAEAVPVKPLHPPRARIYRLARYAVAAMVLVAAGWGLRAALTPDLDTRPVDTYRGTESTELTVRVAPSGLEFSWSAVPDAYWYRVVVWDLEAAKVIGRYETPQTALRAGDSIVEDLRAKLQAGRPYAIRIDAVDAQNRVLLSSESVEFEL